MQNKIFVASCCWWSEKSDLPDLKTILPKNVKNWDGFDRYLGDVKTFYSSHKGKNKRRKWVAKQS